MHQDGERLSVALAGLFDEVSIHVDLSVATAFMAADYPR